MSRTNLLNKTCHIVGVLNTVDDYGQYVESTFIKSTKKCAFRDLTGNEIVALGLPVGVRIIRVYLGNDVDVRQSDKIILNNWELEVLWINNLSDRTGKIQGTQVDCKYLGFCEDGDLPPYFNFLGNWNANLNEPFLTNDPESYNNGDAYQVSVAGNQWDMFFNEGDFAVFDGEKWVKVINTSNQVLSVNGKTGNVVLNAQDIGAYPDTNPDNYATEQWVEDKNYLTTEIDPVFINHPAHNVIDSGDGTKFLSDDNTYKEIEIPDGSKWESDGTGFIKPKDNNLVKVENIDGALTEEIDPIFTQWETDTDYLVENDNISLLNNDSGFISDLSGFTTTDLIESTNLYYTDQRFDDRLATKTTTDLAEGSNLYFTDQRAIDAVDLSGYVPYTGATGDVDLGANDFYVNGASFKSDAIELLGLEMVKNPNFINDSEWTFGGDWYWNGVDKAKISIASAASTLEQSVGIVSGKEYRLRFTISNFVNHGAAARFIPRVGGSNIVGFQGGDGDYEYEFTAPNDGNLQIYAGEGSEFEVSNFSLKSLELETTVGDLLVKNNFRSSLIVANAAEDLVLAPGGNTRNMHFRVTSGGISGDGGAILGRLIDGGSTFRGLHFHQRFDNHIRVLQQTSDVATVKLGLQGQIAFSSATGSNQNGGDVFLQGGTPAGSGEYGNVHLAPDGGDVLMLNDNQDFVQGAGGDYRQYFDGTNQNFDLSSGDFMFSGGNVGIGTTAPVEKLHLRGNLRVQGGSNPNDEARIRLGGFSTATRAAEIKAVNRITSSRSVDLVFSSDSIGTFSEKMRLTHEGRLGLGTTDPTEKLEIDGNIKLSSDNQTIIQGAGSEFSQYFDGTNQNFDLTSGDFVFNGGNLDVEGSIRASRSDSSNYVEFSSVSKINNFPRAGFLVGDGDNTFTNGEIWVAPAGSNQIQTSLTALTNSVTSTHVTKRIGITANPTENKLYSARGNGHDSDVPFKIYANGVNNDATMTFLPSGNVGIGTTDPTEKLEVNGNILSNGDAELSDSDKGVILKSPNGTKYRVQVDNDGSLTTTAL